MEENEIKEEEVKAPAVKVGLRKPIEAWVEELQAASEAERVAHPMKSWAWGRHPMSCACWKCVCECFRSAWNSWRNCPLPAGRREGYSSAAARAKCIEWGVGWETVQKIAAARLGIPSTRLLGSFHELAAASATKLEVWSSLRDSIFTRQQELGGSLWSLWKGIAEEAWQGEPLSMQQKQAAIFELMSEWVEGIWAEAVTVQLLQAGLSSGLLVKSHPEWEGCSCSFAPSSMEKLDVDALITSADGEVVAKVSVKHGEGTLRAGCLRSWALRRPEPTVYAGYTSEEAPADARGLLLFSREQVLGEGEW